MRASKLLVSSSSPAAPKRIQCANFSQSDTLPDTPHLTPATHPKHTLQTPSQTPLPNPSSKTLFEEIRAHPGVCGGLLFTMFLTYLEIRAFFRAEIRVFFRAEIRVFSVRLSVRFSVRKSVPKSVPIFAWVCGPLL